MKRTLPFLLAVAVAFMAGVAGAADLRIKVTGVRSDVGGLKLGLFASPDTFLRPDGVLIDKTVHAKIGEVEVVFADLPPGTYAAAGYHDENGNGEFDQGFFGIPLEGYGFGNGKAARGLPEFSEVAVGLDEPGADIVIRLTY